MMNDPFREMSRYNGTMRPVNRPAPGGWETGVEWYSPITRQWYEQTNALSPIAAGRINN
jgi:hypothetical protein